MATESIEVSGVIHASPDRIYQAWLDSSEHTAMTGGRATIDPTAGGRFTAWDGYIYGSTVELEPGRRIVQSWRSSEFPMDAPSSRLEVRLDPIESGTRITFLHSEIPEGQATRYEQNWREKYLEPMSRYFSSATSSTADAGEEMERAVEARPAAEPRVAKPKPKPKAAARKTASKRKPARKAAKRKKAASRKARKPARKASRKGKGAKRRAPKRSARRGRR